MISDFGESIFDDISLEWKEYLFGYRKEMPTRSESLAALAIKKNANAVESFLTTTVCIPEVSKVLKAFMDKVYGKNKRADLKILFENTDAFCELGISDKIYDQLCKLHSSHEKVRIALRRTEKTNGCIPFHCDGGYATRTVQVCLNSDTEYEGGRLLFFAQGSATARDVPKAL